MTWSKYGKIFHPVVEVGMDCLLEREFHRATRGHRFKLSKPQCRSEIRRRFINVRVVEVWNGLPASVIEADVLGTFKARLDCWMGDAFYLSSF